MSGHNIREFLRVEAASRVVIDTEYEEVGVILDEVSSFFAYGENEELAEGRALLEADLADGWSGLSVLAKKRYVLRGLGELEHTDPARQQAALSKMLYLSLGVYGESETEATVTATMTANTMLFFRSGGLPTVLQLFGQECTRLGSIDTATTNVTMAASRTIRGLAGLLQTMIESAQRILKASSSSPSSTTSSSSSSASTTSSSSSPPPTSPSSSSATTETAADLADLASAKELASELAEPTTDGRVLCAVLLELVCDFGAGRNQFLPIRKLAMLLWKTLMLVHGDLAQHRANAAAARKAAGLPPAPEGQKAVVVPVPKVTKPPPAERIEKELRNPLANLFVVPVDPAAEPSDGEETETEADSEPEATDDADADSDDGAVMVVAELGAEFDPMADPSPAPSSTATDSELEGGGGGGGGGSSAEKGPTARASMEMGDGDGEIFFAKPSVQKLTGAPTQSSGTVERIAKHRGSLGPRRTPVVALEPKVSQECLDKFNADLSTKFQGYYDKDTDTIGPTPALQQALAVLESRLYVPLSEHQARVEAAAEAAAAETLDPFAEPLSRPAATPIDTLYGQIVWSLGRYAVSLLKILGFCTLPVKTSTTSKFASEVGAASSGPKGKVSPLQVAQDAEDATRLKEVTTKAITSALLLLLKHFRTQHIYQFETLSTALVDADGIPLLLKILNQDFAGFLTASSGVPELELRAIALARPAGDAADGGGGSLADDETSGAVLSARNYVSGVNFLRILQKLTKKRQTRVLHLVFNKSHTVLRKILDVQNRTIQLYALKLLKDQSRYMGKAWRKNNMAILSSIDKNVRHHVNDPWFYDNMGATEPCPLTKEQDAALLEAVDAFNERYYAHDTEEDALVQDMNATSIFDLKWHGDEFQWSGGALPQLEGYDEPLLKPAAGSEGSMWGWAELVDAV